MPGAEAEHALHPDKKHPSLEQRLLPLALLAGLLAGAVWGAIPGLLKARTGAHEVINTIMMNYIAFRLSDWLLSGPMMRPDSFNPVSPTIVYLTKMYGSGNTGSYRGQFRVERMFQDSDALGLTLQTALSDPLSTLVTGSAGRITEDHGWPNVETRIELGLGPRSTIRGSQVRPVEFGVSGVVGQFRTTRTMIRPRLKI